METNEFYQVSNIGLYLDAYAGSVYFRLREIKNEAIEAAFTRIIETAKYGGTLYVAGNGGSAAISEHLMTDFMKGAGLKVISLCSNVSLLTALANDLSYADVFKAQLEMLGACRRDCLLLISSSGNSKNIVNAAEYAASVSMPVIGLSGFSGGKLRELSSVSLHIDANNYGVVEDCHQAIMHVLAQWAKVENK